MSFNYPLFERLLVLYNFDVSVCLHFREYFKQTAFLNVLRWEAKTI